MEGVTPDSAVFCLDSCFRPSSCENDAGTSRNDERERTDNCEAIEIRSR
jgi:hypothetical protein